MPQLPAAILILAERPHPDKQKIVAFAAAAAEQLVVYTLCYTWQACLALIRTGLIATVVCALDPGDAARAAIEDGGGRLIVAREDPNRSRRDVHQLAARMYERGIDTQEISQILQVSSSDVRRSLWGIRRSKSHDE